MRLAKSVFSSMLITLAIAVSATTARAQENSGAYALGSLGYGLLVDDEGGLGAGVAPGAGAGWLISDRFAIEVAAGKLRPEQTGSLSWVGDPFTVTARAVFRFLGPNAPVRPFVAAGVGYFRYTGTFTEEVFLAPGVAPTRVSTDWQVSSAVVEGGGGGEIPIGRVVFVRPEAWLAIASPARVRPAPEPPYAMPRYAVSLGVRF